MSMQDVEMDGTSIGGGVRNVLQENTKKGGMTGQDVTGAKWVSIKTQRDRKHASRVRLERLLILKDLMSCQTAKIATRVRLLMLNALLATTVPRGNMPRTQEPANAGIVREESIMMKKSKQLASPVVPVSIIRM
jgi:hypothetical protein